MSRSSFAQALRRRKAAELERNFSDSPPPEGKETAEFGIGAEDPRPDLAEDSALWRELLRRARELGDRIYEVLHGFRCLGTRIEAGDGRHRLVPLYDPRLGWNSEAEYAEARERWLKPLGREITALLRALDGAGEAGVASARGAAQARRKSTWGKCSKCGAVTWVGEEGEGTCAACEAKGKQTVQGLNPSPASPA